jgi:hypothetical protein
VGTEKSLNQILQEEAGLGPNWVVADQPPIRPGRAPAPPQGDSSNKNLVGSIPESAQLNDSFVGTSYDSPRIPKLSIMPLAPSGQPQANSGVHSNAAPLIFPVAQQAAEAQSTADTAQATADAVAAVSFQGAYDAGTTYAQGASVDYSGTIYVSLINSNIGNTPSSSPTDWVATGGSNTSVFLGAWSSATAYVLGNQVTYNGGYYIALLNNTNKQPNTNPTDWQLISSTNNYVYLGAYSGATAYVVGNQVSYQGSFWICISNTTGNAPSTASSFWTLLGTSAILIGAWSSSTTYVQGNEVTNSGNIFQALQGNTNQTPPTPPATSAYWQLIGPSDLGSVADGSQRFAATASTLTYRPTTNPLTATDAGSNATINIASFTMRTSSKGDISINSGSITALSYSTLYYIYYDDATLAGGAVTFNATTAKTTAINGTGRFFIGSIVTPAATAPDTTGNNDGGVGAQAGGTTVFLFGSAVSAGVSGQGSVTSPTNAIDGSFTTFATAAIGSGGSAASGASVTCSAASPTSAPWTSLTLYALWEVTANTVNPGATPASLSYGGAGGGTLDSVGPATTKAKTLVSVSLPVNTNLATMSVSLSVFRNNGFAQVVTAHLYQAWIVGIQ